MQHHQRGAERAAHAEHARRGHEFIAAPVFGRPNVAEEGRLWIVAAGAEPAVAKARPLLETFSRGISVVGTEPRQAHALKLGGNFLISAMIYSLSESFVYAAGQGIDPAIFLETVNSALFQSPFYAAYANVMLHPPEHPGATIELGEKDLRLLREAAAASGTQPRVLADSLAGRLFPRKGRWPQPRGLGRGHVPHVTAGKSNAHP